MTKEAFLQNVTEQIRCVRARDGIARELSDHITDQAAAYEEAGEAHEEAVNRAVQEMGDPVEVGVELDRIHRPQIDYKLIGMAFLFHIAGFFLIWLMGDFSNNPQYIGRQCVVLLLSFGVMAGMYFLDYSFLARYAYGIGIFVTAALLISNLFSLREGRVSGMMPGYLYVPVFAGILYRLRNRGYRALLWAMGMQFVIAYLALTLSGLAAANIYLMCTVLLVIAVAKGWFSVRRKAAVAAMTGALMLLPLVLAFLKISVFGNGYRAHRLLAWLDPERDAAGAGYVYQWLRQEWGMVRWIGAADNAPLLGESLIGGPFFTEPFILLQLICRYGILAGAALTAAFAAVVVRAFQIAKRQKNQLGFMLSVASFMVILDRKSVV